MKQRIVIKMHLESGKCRSKALGVAAKSQGVQSLSIEGESCDRLVVIGDEVDAVCLTNQLRKKFRDAMLLNVEDIVEDFNEGVDESDEGESDNENEREEAAEDERDETTPMENYHPLPHYHDHYLPPPTNYHQVVYDPSYPNTCAIV